MERLLFLYLIFVFAGDHDAREMSPSKAFLSNLKATDFLQARRVYTRFAIYWVFYRQSDLSPSQRTCFRLWLDVGQGSVTKAAEVFVSILCCCCCSVMVGTIIKSETLF